MTVWQWGYGDTSDLWGSEIVKRLRTLALRNAGEGRLIFAIAIVILLENKGCNFPVVFGSLTNGRVFFSAQAMPLM